MIKFSESFHLSSYIDRLILNETDRLLLHTTYSFAMKNGGSKELDFTRPEGQSFNPRPARIALILLQDAKNKNPNTIAAAMLATVDKASFSTLKAGENSHIPSSIINTAERSLSPAAEFLSTKIDKHQEESLIALSLHLDRARHFHLSPSVHIINERETLLQDTYKFIELASSLNPKLHTLLTAWENRFSKQHQKLLKDPHSIQNNFNLKSKST